MALLITPDKINELAYLTPQPVETFKEVIIAQVQEVDVRSILTISLYDAVIDDPATFTVLINNYIQPYMAYRIKELILTLQQTESVSAAVSYSDSLSDSIAYASDLAGIHYQNLNLFIARTYAIGAKWVAGIIIEEIENPPHDLPPFDPPPPVVNPHGHNCDDIFLPDIDDPPSLISLCAWADKIDNRLADDYLFAKVSNVNIPDANWVPVVQLVTPPLSIGTYEFKLAFTWNLDSAIHSILFRFSTDGGTIWENWISEPSDITNNVPFSYFFPIDITASDTVMDLQFQSSLENAADDGNITFADIIFERKI